MTIRPGFSRDSSVATTAGTPLGETSSTGPPRRPAAAAPESASGKSTPVATYATATPGVNVAALIAADVAYRSTPARRDTDPEDTAATAGPATATVVPNPAATTTATTTDITRARNDPMTQPHLPNQAVAWHRRGNEPNASTRAQVRDEFAADCRKDNAPHELPGVSKGSDRESS